MHPSRYTEEHTLHLVIQRIPESNGVRIFSKKPKGFYLSSMDIPLACTSLIVYAQRFIIRCKDLQLEPGEIVKIRGACTPEELLRGDEYRFCVQIAEPKMLPFLRGVAEEQRVQTRQLLALVNGSFPNGLPLFIVHDHTGRDPWLDYTITQALIASQLN